MSSPEALKILADAEKAKQERIERENKEELERLKKIEEEKAKEKLDEQVRQDQEDEAAWDAWVESQKNQEPERGPPTLTTGGTTFVWSGHPEANVRSPPVDTEFQNRVNQILEEQERTTQTMIESRQIAMAVQKVIAEQIAKIRAVVNGTLDYGPDSMGKLKQEIDELRAKRDEWQRKRQEAFTECTNSTVAKEKAWVKIETRTRKGQNIVRGTRTIYRPENTTSYCWDEVWRIYPEESRPDTSALAEKENTWADATRWATSFNHLIEQLRKMASDDFISQREQKKIYDTIETASALIQSAIAQGVKPNMIILQTLQAEMLNAIDAIRDQENRQLAETKAEEDRI